MYVQTDATGRIMVSAPEPIGPGEIQFDFPEGFDFSRQGDWRIVGGELVHDPLPGGEPPINPIDDLTAVTVDHEYRLILMEMGVTNDAV